VLPLATSYIICEALGFEAAVNRKFSEAPFFFTLFGTGLVIGAAVVLIPGIPLLKLILFAQVLQDILLPAELVLMLIVINRKSVMGNYVNTPLANWIACDRNRHRCAIDRLRVGPVHSAASRRLAARALKPLRAASASAKHQRLRPSRLAV